MHHTERIFCYITVHKPGSEKPGKPRTKVPVLRALRANDLTLGHMMFISRFSGKIYRIKIDSSYLLDRITSDL